MSTSGNWARGSRLSTRGSSFCVSSKTCGSVAALQRGELCRADLWILVHQRSEDDGPSTVGIVRGVDNLLRHRGDQFGRVLAMGFRGIADLIGSMADDLDGHRLT